MDVIDDILAACRDAISSVDPDSRNELIESIIDSRKTFIYGSGRSGLAGQLFAVRLVQLGFDVHFVGEMTTPIIGADDLTLLISNTGNTSSVCQTAKIARKIGSRVISLTSDGESELADNSDVFIVMDVPRDLETAPLGTIFEDSSIIFFDGIVAEIMERLEITEDDMRRRHAIWVRSLVDQYIRFRQVRTIDDECLLQRIQDHNDAGSRRYIKGGRVGGQGRSDAYAHIHSA